MPLFRFRCRAGHVFTAEGDYSQFDMARVCSGSDGCREPAFMLVDQMAAMHGPDSATARADREAYAKHNVTHTHSRNGGQIIGRPNAPSMQCQCGQCNSHRRRAVRTEVADCPSSKTDGKEVRL